ncbi:MAG: UDPGP type 1 family protein [Lachnospiraceae bacterium]|nr:UDPGP type 1 family protein [Lachnospiraceae bacterium]
MTFEEARAKCEKFNQEQLLKYYGELNDKEKEALLAQIEETDFGVIERAAHQAGKGKITPIKVLTAKDIEDNRKKYEETGLEAIRQGKVAAVLLAGGMGTRLGSDKPKGCFNMGVTRELFIFECLINNLMDVVRKADKYIHLFVMTSDKNHEATMEFFKEHEFFGYKGEYVHFFKQEMAPATDMQGKILLEEKGRLATSPNGNGGWFSSLYHSGLEMCIREEGIEWLNVFAVDNVLQRMADPVFVGSVIDGGFTSGSKVIKKAARDEKVGVICLEDGRPSIVEYYELTDKLMNEKFPDGSYAYDYGVILNYLFKVEELEKIIDNPLPLHIVDKKIPCIDNNGNPVSPAEPNGHKYETLILDMIHMMKDNLPFEVVREHEFAPVKNKEGIDSVVSARELLERNGVKL